MSQEVRVLVGDDDVMDRVYVGWGFKKWCPEIRVDFARNGEEVIRYLEDKSHPKPALVILDSMEPKVDGFAVVTWLRTCKELEATQVVMWSGRIYEENVARARGLGVKEYLGKPRNPNELREIIKSWKRSYLMPANSETDAGTRRVQEEDTQQFFKLQ
jgi:chemosensory pili system protein ChpA (sensor histidine kinase/response regulator)